MKNINRRDQAAILFCLGNHPNVDIYEVKRYTKAITEGPDTGFFQEDEELVTVNLDDLESNQTEAATELLGIIQQLMRTYLGGQIQDEE